MAQKYQFPNGVRVKVNDEGAVRFVNLAGHFGTVVGRSYYRHCVRVRWDHLKAAKIIRVDMLKRSGEVQTADFNRSYYPKATVSSAVTDDVGSAGTANEEVHWDRRKPRSM